MSPSVVPDVSGVLTNSISYVGGVFSSLKPLLYLFIGLSVAFFIIWVIINHFRNLAEEKMAERRYIMRLVYDISIKQLQEDIKKAWADSKNIEEFISKIKLASFRHKKLVKVLEKEL